ncbi:hypothetical protein [Arsenicibacter rosenii]|uniref:Uncharacterized protein n=1 Tax=Arsenicibacter rosenii TaxID=1750698 RepID=A0A1S2VND2_9BACT|nr:hypothetical protein [Arsenicibacter rosenii]OIN60269.1 hypothetical protein BLX24_05405 [Arsenicibacter rosenii]
MLDLEIDKLTNSIENTITGEVFETSVLPFQGERKGFNKKDWLFDWKVECKDSSRKVFKLVTSQNRYIIQGLISFSDNHDHIFMHLIESARFNKGPQKLYLGVAGNLIAYACLYSFDLGYDGIVVFDSKTMLINHYQQALGAKQLAGNRLFIDTKESNQLVKRYFP